MFEMITNTLQSPLPTPTSTVLIPPADEASISVFIVIAGAGLVLALALLLYNVLRTEQGYPLEKELEAVLMPYLQSGIIGAFEETIDGLGVIEGRIQQLDKEDLAERIYGLLPDKIGEYNVSVFKNVFTEEQFEQMFLNAYDQALEYYISHKDRFVDLFEEKYS